MSNLVILRQLREMKGLSQKDTARYFGFREESGRLRVGKWERGEEPPALRHRARFMSYLLDELGLRDNPDQFDQVWKILVVAWGWPDEIKPQLAVYNSQKQTDSVNKANAGCQTPKSLSADRSKGFQQYEQYTSEMSEIDREQLPFLGRTSERAYIQTFLDDPDTRVMVVFGPKGIGKTRLLLEVIDESKDYCLKTVVACEASKLSTIEFFDLADSSGELIVLIEDATDVEGLIKKALPIKNTKFLITFSTMMERPRIYREDSRVVHLPLRPLSLSDDGVRNFFSQELHISDDKIAASILEEARGNPAILAIAKKYNLQRQQSRASFVEEIVNLVEEEIIRERGEQFLTLIGCLSILTCVYCKDIETELKQICEKFKYDINIMGTILKIELPYVFRKNGDYIEIWPSVLGDHLAIKVLHGRSTDLYKLFEALPSPGRRRLIQRLIQIKQYSVSSSGAIEVVEEFGKALFGSGILSNPEVLHKSPYLLWLVTEAFPQKVASHVMATIREENLNQLRTMQEEAYRYLLQILETLLLLNITCDSALSSLILLVKAHAGLDRRDAANLLYKCFHAYHPCFPMSLDERSKKLSSLVCLDASQEDHAIGADIIDAIFSYSPRFIPYSNGMSVPNNEVKIDHREIKEYYFDIVVLLIKLYRFYTDYDVKLHIFIRVQSTLIKVLEMLIAQSEAEYILPILEKVKNLSPQQLSHSTSEMHRILQISKNKLSRMQQTSEVEQSLDIINILTDQLTNDVFSRIKYWSGASLSEDALMLEDDGLLRRDHELRLLASEVIAQPDQLTDKAIDWLCSSSSGCTAKFARWLGELDIQNRLAGRIELVAADQRAADLFVNYVKGLSRTNRVMAASFLKDVCNRRCASDRVVIEAIYAIGLDMEGLACINKLVAEERISRLNIVSWLSTSHLKELSTDQYLQLLQIIGTIKQEVASIVISHLSHWLSYKKLIDEPLIEVAWNCLEIIANEREDISFDYKEIVTFLVPKDIERSFRLLETLLDQTTLDFSDFKDIWKLLWSYDRLRVYRLTLSAMSCTLLQQIRLSKSIRNFVECEKDESSLVKSALQSREFLQILPRLLPFHHKGNSSEQKKSILEIISFIQEKHWIENDQLLAALSEMNLDPREKSILSIQLLDK